MRDGSRTHGSAGGQRAIPRFPRLRHARRFGANLAAITWISCRRVLSLAVALAAGDSRIDSGSASGTEKVMDLSASPWPATFDSSAGLATTVAPGRQAMARTTG